MRQQQKATGILGWPLRQIRGGLDHPCVFYNAAVGRYPMKREIDIGATPRWLNPEDPHPLFGNTGHETDGLGEVQVGFGTLPNRHFSRR